MKLAQIVFQLHWCPTFQQVEYTDRSSTDTEVRGTRGFGGDEFENVMHNCGSSVIETIEAYLVNLKNTWFLSSSKLAQLSRISQLRDF
ncbi:hypothetical protein CEXT_112351 [Caerostris extrusa]|uniref:Uncharacterized protein n=1 Tax=Caerostris extrusa TaxID=172846 RepID=A0AAV4WFQ0_CAEEX|nr:hypothetical protein CEXT_112351 [Caerostris extrusa]